MFITNGIWNGTYRIAGAHATLENEDRKFANPID
jgi:hypothetical protein